MAPLLLLFLLGGLCALFSLTISSCAANKCEEPRHSDGGCVPEATQQGQQQQGKTKQPPARGPDDPEKDLGIVFSTFDHDGDGFIMAVELEESLRCLGIAVSAHEAAAMVARVNANSDGLIDIHEFRELYDSIPKKRKHHQHQHPAAGGGFGGAAAREVPVEGDDDDQEEEADDEERDLREAFDVFDDNKDGLISAKELGTVLGSLCLRRQLGNGRAAVADCRDMIRLVDVDGDGMVSFEEFKRMMTVVKA